MCIELKNVFEDHEKIWLNSFFLPSSTVGSATPELEAPALACWALVWVEGAPCCTPFSKTTFWFIVDDWSEISMSLESSSKVENWFWCVGKTLRSGSGSFGFLSSRSLRPSRISLFYALASASAFFAFWATAPALFLMCSIWDCSIHIFEYVYSCGIFRICFSDEIYLG